MPDEEMDEQGQNDNPTDMPEDRETKVRLLETLKASHSGIADRIARLQAALAPVPEPQCVPLVMGGICPKCGYERKEGNLEPHPVA